MPDLISTVNRAIGKVPAWLLYILAPLPLVWWFYLGVSGGLGVEPVKELEHRAGEFALQLLIFGLAITPLRRFANLNLMKQRRAIGVIAFFYVFAHLLIWLILDMQFFWSQILGDIVKRPYITIGMAAFVLLVPLAITSNNLSVRKLGPKWRKLHKLVYAAALLGGLHFVLLVKGFQIEPLLYLGATILLLALRMIPKKRRVAARA